MGRCLGRGGGGEGMERLGEGSRHGTARGGRGRGGDCAREPLDGGADVLMHVSV